MKETLDRTNLGLLKVGDKVTATATVTKIDGKKIEFRLSAHSGEVLLGEGTHLRFIVERERFMSKLA